MINALSSSIPQPVNSGGAIQANNDKSSGLQKPDTVEARDNKTQPIEAEAAKTQAATPQNDQTAASVDIYAAADQAQEAAQASGSSVERGSVIDVSV